MIEKEGFNFSFNPLACQSCEGRCCTGESGYIYATKPELQAMAALLKLEWEEFLKAYVKETNNGFSLKEVRYNDSYDCIFYDRARKGCQIYEARPKQCRTFPFWDYFKHHKEELEAECPGVTFKDV